MSTIQKKLVVVGDGDCGKTCLLISFTTNIFEVDYIPTVFDTRVKNVHIGNKTIDLSLEDTAGQEDYDRLRPIQYNGSNVFLLCFSIVRRDSYENAINKWVPEIKHFCPNVPFLLIGTKVDLRIDQETLDKLQKEKKPPVKTAEAQIMAKKIGAVCYMECSAKTMFNVKDVFLQATKATLTVNRKKKACSLI